MWRVLAIGAVLFCLSTGLGVACRSPSSQASIIFDDVPKTIEAPVIVEVTIDEMSDVVDSTTGLPWVVMITRVERVIRGPIDSRTLKIVTELSDCTTGFGVGSHGIVLGALRHDAHGIVELVAIPESIIERKLRKAGERSN